MVNNRLAGAEAEKIGAKFLKKQGYRIIENNFSTRNGEIDIIAMENNELVFVEVKFRSSDKYGSPCEAVDGFKQKKIIKAAAHYINLKNLFDENIRFDVLSIGPGIDNIELIKSAFTMD